MTREEASQSIQALRLQVEEPTDTKLGWLETWIYKEDVEAMKMAIEALEQEPRWIPVSEKLPDKSGYYLVSGKGKVWVCEMLILMGTKGWTNDARNPIVEAWMPLPKAYREVEECQHHEN